MSPVDLNSSCQIRIEAKGPQTSGCTSKDSRSIHTVAQEFESMMEFARENLARLISQNGGIGMAHFLENALNRADTASPVSPAPVLPPPVPTAPASPPLP